MRKGACRDIRIRFLPVTLLVHKLVQSQTHDRARKLKVLLHVVGVMLAAVCSSGWGQNDVTTVPLAVASNTIATTAAVAPLVLPEFQPTATLTLAQLPPGLSDTEWAAAAEKIARARKEARRQPILNYTSAHDQIVFRVNLETAKDHKVVIPLAVPASAFQRATWNELEAETPQTTEPVIQPVVQFTEVGYIRNVRVGRVAVNMSGIPSAQAKITSGVVRLYFEQSETSVTQNGEVTKGVLHSLLERFVENTQDIKNFARDAAGVPGAQTDEQWVPTQSAQSPFWIKIPVREDGVYRIPAADLKAAGVSLANLNPQHLHLVLEGREQPLVHFPAIKAQATDSTNANDAFLFYGAQNESEHTVVNNYWLFTDATKPRPSLATSGADPATTVVEPASFFPGKILVEEDNEVVTKNDQFLTILDYRWVWKELTTGTRVTSTFDVPGAPRMERQLPGKVHLYVSSFPAGRQYAVRVRINTIEIPDMIISDARDIDLPFRVPLSALQPTSNSLSVQLLDVQSTASTATAARNSAEIYLDRVEIAYPRTYVAAEEALSFSSPSPALEGDVVVSTAPRNVDYRISGLRSGFRGAAFNITDDEPKVVQGQVQRSRRIVEGAGFVFQQFESAPQQYVLSSVDAAATVSLQAVRGRPDLRSRDNQADYLIVSHRMFIPAIAPFAEVKTASGFIVKVVDVDDVYNQFGAGQETPDAIKRFIRYAAQNWRGSVRNAAATYVLFVGDSSSAYRGQFRNNIINYVPTYTVGTPGTSDRYASENWFACGFGNDILPDALLGRFSVNNVKDLQSLLDKQFTYKTRPGAGGWRNLLAYVGDHSEFEETLEKVMHESVPNRFFVKRILMAEEPWVDNYYFPAEIADAKKAKVSPATTRKIRDMFNAGAAMVTYFGHGSPNVWSNERIWFGGDSENSDNLMLTNRDRLPLVMTLTCNTGAIDYPKERWNVSISEDMMRLPNGGAVACYVPSGPGVTSQHERYTMQMNRALLEEFVRPVQAAFTLGMWRYTAADNPPDLPQMFLLLGDPSLELLLPEAASDATVTPVQTPAGHAIKLQPASPGALYQVYDEQPEFVASDVQPLNAANGEVSFPGSLDRAVDSYHASLLLPSAGARPDQSLAVGLLKVPYLAVESAGRTSAEVVHAGDLVRMEVKLRSKADTPQRKVEVGIANARGDVIATATLSMLPHDVETVYFHATAQPGINRFYVVQFGVKGATKVDGTEMVFAAAPTEQPAGAAPALIDEQALQISYHGFQGGALSGMIKGQVHSVRDVSVLDLSAKLMGANEEVVASAPVPPIAPGASSEFALRFDGLRTFGDMFVQLGSSDDSTTFADTRVPVHIGPNNFPDIAVASVRAQNSSPADGETVFFDAIVQNRGRSAAENIKVEAFDGQTSSGPRLESRVTQDTMIERLEPASSETVTLRWDPFRNAGQHQLLFTASSTGSFPEIDSSNNSTTLSLRVRTKYDLRPVGIKPEVTPEDRRLLQVRLTARVENRGESPAHGVKVVFYPTPDRRDPKTAMGEAIIDVIPPKSIGEAKIIYKLKPGEEKREFRPSFRAFLKGSLQRVSTPGID